MPDHKPDTQNLCIAIVMVASVGYATVRYHVCKGVPWADWPMWTLNKAFAVGSLALLLAAAIYRRSNSKVYCGKLFSASVTTAGLHILLSLVLLNPDYYAKFFSGDGKLTAWAAWSMLFGALPAMIMVRRTHGPTQKPSLKKVHNHVDSRQMWSVVLVANLVTIHTFSQGWSGWFDWSQWPGRLPPLTLISFIFGISTVMIAAWPTRNKMN